MQASQPQRHVMVIVHRTSPFVLMAGGGRAYFATEILEGMVKHCKCFFK